MNIDLIEPDTASGAKRSRAAGFTLIEIILVVGIILVITSVTLPTFVNSMRGAKLKASARAISMAHRYARSVSVLQQKNCAIFLDTVNGKIKVVSLNAESGSNGRMTDLPSMNQDDEDTQYTPNDELIKKLEDDVWFDRVEIRDGEQNVDGIYIIKYYPNGMCDKYEVYLRDDKDLRKHIDIDNISGSVMIEDV